MLRVLYRLLVLPFYVRNAGTFGVVAYFTFGFMRASDHEFLIDAALRSPVLLAGVFGLWVAFAGRTISFVRNELARPEHLFLNTFRLVPTRTRRLYWALLMLALLGPILTYAGWMAVRAVQGQTWESLAGIGVAISGILVAGVALIDYRLRHTHIGNSRRLRVPIQLPYELFFPTYWLRHEPLSALLTKLISGGLLLGVCRLYPTDDYDGRLLLIGLMLALITHAQLGRTLTEFEQRYLILLPNLPLSRWQRFGRYTLTYGLIWLPEGLILFRNCPTAVRFSYVGLLWLTGWGWLMLMHSLAYGRTIPPERWQTGVFWSFIAGLLAIMFGLPVGAWLTLGWLTALAGWYWKTTQPQTQ